MKKVLVVGMVAVSLLVGCGKQEVKMETGNEYAARVQAEQFFPGHKLPNGYTAKLDKNSGVVVKDDNGKFVLSAYHGKLILDERK